MAPATAGPTALVGAAVPRSVKGSPQLRSVRDAAAVLPESPPDGEVLGSPGAKMR